MFTRQLLSRCTTSSNAQLNASRCLSLSGAQLASGSSGSSKTAGSVAVYEGVKGKDFVQTAKLERRELLANTFITPEGLLDVSKLGGVPEEHVRNRRVRIFKSAKTSMQSATFDTQYWKIEFETRERWENPLMGWCSSGDPLSNLILQFGDVNDAIAFCQKNGWTFHVDAPQERKMPKLKSYADNFAWNKRTRVSSK